MASIERAGPACWAAPAKLARQPNAIARKGLINYHLIPWRGGRGGDWDVRPLNSLRRRPHDDRFPEVHYLTSETRTDGSSGTPPRDLHQFRPGSEPATRMPVSITGPG